MAENDSVTEASEEKAPKEELIWRGSPSQIVNLKTFVTALFLCVLIVPIFVAFWKWLETRCFRYELTTQRLKIRKGVFSRHTDELELYRVKDTALVEPFVYRLFSLGRIVLQTSDQTTPVVVIEAVPRAERLRDCIRDIVECLRDKKRVREVDFQ